MHAPRFPAVLVFAAAALAAQGTHTISPAGLGPVLGGNSTGYPWGYATYAAFRYQQIHDDLAGLPRVLLGLAVRRKETGAAHTAVSPTLQLDLSTAAVGSQLATSTFANNHGANRTVVMAARVVNFPPVNPPTNALAAPFTYVMMFDAPYVHLGAGGICWEALMTANAYTGATMIFDLAQGALARNVPFGLGCGGASLTGSYTAPNLVQSASGLTPSSTAVLLLGANNERFAGQPLPLDLAIINAPGCSLFLDPLVTISTPVDAAGNATVTTDISALPPSFMINTQILAPSAQVPLGFAFSNGLFQAPSMPRTFMRNWISNIASVTGNLQTVYALVTDFIGP